MEKYENQGLVGEGSYGMVLKCKHKETGQLVAIKKFLESEDDKMVKKIALREVRMLKQLRHDNLVNLLEVFRRKKRLYLVFEFVDHTVLDELEKCPNGLDETTCRKILWQVLKGIEFCHHNNIIHRDIKPENILVSKNGVVKLCDFGFARTLAQPGEIYTDYVATRWYRAPELLVGDTKYGKAVDVWAVGCLLVEMLTGEPLFPGDSDIDQLYHIVKVFGNLTARHKEVFLRNPLFVGMRLPEVREVTPLEKKFTRMSQFSLALIKVCLRLDPDDRPVCSELLKHEFFTRDGFAQKFSHDLKARLTKEQEKNALLHSIVHDKDDDGDNNKAVKKKKKPLIKKVEAHSKVESNKASSNKDEKHSSEDKSKQKGSDTDKGASKKVTPPSTTNKSNALMTSDNSKQKNSLVNGDSTPVDKRSNSLDKTDGKTVKIPKVETKTDKSEKERSSCEKTDRDLTRIELKEKTKLELKHEKYEKSDREKDSLENRSDSRLDKIDKMETSVDRNKGADSRLEMSKEKGDVKVEREKREKSDKLENERDESRTSKERERDREKENIMSFKDSSTIPPINPSGHGLHSMNNTPTIPSLTRISIFLNNSSPNMMNSNMTPHPHIFAPPVNNMTATQSPRGAVTPYSGAMPLRTSSFRSPEGKPYSWQAYWNFSKVNDKMLKKQANYKKAPPNHHSVLISPQPLQSEKSHLHDKSLEKLRTQKRETTLFDVRRDKEMISFPEVRGAEASSLKVKSKTQTLSRSNVATIPHITNIDPFPSSSQVETHTSEKSNENNLPSV
ncbi:cyclin-dependent kinase-like 2 isoform X2 [Mya arenaria]|uniref:cyclin-dependent kinase-like 2 isoform X2 n=1 Tax=Mya arenaria TaxID=6604 RepID=UPI0022E00FAF|nr:cyclin-dependent kinase-like 2 isoform X2 [Mya arenaria]